VRALLQSLAALPVSSAFAENTAAVSNE
jgi:hypothetical protein